MAKTRGEPAVEPEEATQEATVDTAQETDNEETATDDYVRRIVAARRVVKDREEVYERAKNAAKAAKVDWEDAVAGLGAVIDRGPEILPLFDTPAKENAAANEEDGDAWRDADVAELGLPAGVVEKLAEAEVDTVGQLEDLRADIAQGKKEWPKGIGPAKVTQIEDAVLDFLKEFQ